MTMTAEEFIQHLSERPWSEYTAADYSVEQWHAACLIHQHEGPPTSKSECKLPVKTPNGAVNRNGVHAAAAALAGARGGVNASAEQKASAKAAIRRLYSQMGEKPPPSMAQSAVKEILEHHGVKGMKWGVRRPRSRVSKTGGSRTPAAKSTSTGKTEFGKSPSRLSDAELNRRVKRMKVEKEYNELRKKDVSEGKKYTNDILKQTGKTVATTLLAGAVLYGIGRALSTKIGPGAAGAITGRNLPTNVQFPTKLRAPLPPPAPGTRKG